uniref:Uncharacterized protein n=1 Tax=Trypanosoma rangeli TaxID=5698 RepID=R9TL24_TRYRA|nr:hypothetical protein [Trypanosoma rangeli]
MAYTYALIATALLAVSNIVSAEDKKKDEKEFPLVWVCLGITVVGVAIALYVAYRRPDELHLPGSTVMVATESEMQNGNNEPAKKDALNDDFERV